MAKTMAQKTVRVYIVDDHHIVRAGLRAIFEEYGQIQVVGEAGDASSTLREVPALHPEVVLVDVRLPGQDGCSLCRQLKSLPQAPRVLMLTSFGGADLVLEALASGADGYVLKDSRDDVLVAAITTVAAGQTVWPALATRGFREGPPRDGEKNPNRLHLLSPQEGRVLALMAEGRTNKEIGQTFSVSAKTVRNQASSLMRKLEVARRAQAAAYYVKFADHTPAGLAGP
jgi:DNA-binding NarL/FixJ family response regulator